MTFKMQDNADCQCDNKGDNQCDTYVCFSFHQKWFRFPYSSDTTVNLTEKFTLQDYLSFIPIRLNRKVGEAISIHRRISGRR